MRFGMVGDNPVERAVVAEALRPRGVVVIGDSIRLAPHGADLMGSFLDPCFALTSRAGPRTLDEMAHWQRAGGQGLAA